MHALMQHCDDADLAAAQHLPVNEMRLIAADVTVHAKFSEDLTPGNAAIGDGLKSLEQPADVGLGLNRSLSVVGVTVDFVQAMPGIALNSKSIHAPESVRPRRMTVSASSG